MAGQLVNDQISDCGVVWSVSDSVQDYCVSENCEEDCLTMDDLRWRVSAAYMRYFTSCIEEFEAASRWNDAKLRGSNTPEMFRTEKISVHENSDADCNRPMVAKNTLLTEVFGVATRVFYDDQNFTSIKIPEVAPRLESIREIFEKRTIRQPNVLDGGSLRRTFYQNATGKRWSVMDLHKCSQAWDSMKKVGYYEAFNTVFKGCNTSKTCGTINRSICQNATKPDGNETLFFPNLLVRKMKDTESKEELREATRVFESYQNSESVQNRVGVASRLEGRRGIFKRRTIRTPNVPDDGYSWKRYDQKAIPNSKYLRIYFRCPNKYSQGCQASRWVQRIESDAPLFKVTYIGRHTCNQLPQKEGTELLILSLTFVFEILSIIFERLNYALAGMVMSIVGFMICMAEFCYRARDEKVTLRWRGNLPLLYSRYPTQKPFGSIIQWFGLVAAYRVAMPRVLHFIRENEENPAKLVIAAGVFCISLAVTKIV